MAESVRKKHTPPSTDRHTAMCPWGCGAKYSTDEKNSLLSHLNKCQGGGSKKRQALVRRQGGRR